MKFGSTRHTRLLATASAGAMFVAFAPHMALAQGEADSGERVESEVVRTLDVVTVSASGRLKSAQDTAISLTAISEEQIDRFGIADLEDLSKTTPGLYYASGLGLSDSRPVIRGITNPRASSLPAVGVFIDGVDVGSRTGGNIQSFDVDRVEIVRGPQSALFGRGVLAGAINYISHRPSMDGFFGKVEATAAELGEYSVQGRIEGPVSDSLALSLSAKHRELEGTYKDQTSGKYLGGDEATSVAASGRLFFGPDRAGEAFMRVSYSDETQDQAAWNNVAPNTVVSPPAGVWFVGEVPFEETLVDVNDIDYGGLQREFTRTALIIDYDFDFATLTSRSSYDSVDIEQDVDADFSGAPAFPVPGVGVFGNFRAQLGQTIDSYSQELRLTSPDADRFRWILGGYIRQEDMDEAAFTFLSGDLTPEPTPSLLTRETQTLGVFGAVAYDFTDAFTVNAELRWSQDTVDETTLLRTATTEQAFSETFENVLPRVIAEFRPSDNILLYGSAAKGNKPGGFNNSSSAGFSPVPDNLLAFDEEEAWSYEIGVKSELFDNTLTLNAAVFQIDWSDIQVSSQVVVGGFPVGYTANGAVAESTGFEIEFAAMPTNALTFSGGISYSPIRIQDYVDSRVARAGIVTDGDDSLSNSPDWTANLSAEYRQPVFQDCDGYVQANLSYNSTLYATTANLAETGDRVLSDFYVGVSNDRFNVDVFLKNAFDEDVPAGLEAFVNPTTFARSFLVQPTKPRQLGVRVGMNF